MLWFLFGLLRQGPPSIWYWVVPRRRETFESADSDYADDPDWEYSELLGNHGRVQEPPVRVLKVSSLI